MPRSRGRGIDEGYEIRRRKPSRNTRKRILIVCEGETEEAYFTDFMRANRCNIVCEIAGVPMTVVGSAIEHLRSREDWDRIYCVFDQDEHPKVKEAITLAEANRIPYGFSNPCFELWYLLHWQEQTAHIERDRLESKVKRKYSGWEKPKSLYGATSGDRSLLLDAKRRARDGRTRHTRCGRESTSNPSTTMDLVMEGLLEMLGDE